MERLPECLLLRILATLSLPPRQVLRLRLVCKAWNALLSSSHFLQTLAFHSPHLHHLPCFAFAPLPLHGSPHSRLLLYSPYLGTWLHTHFPLPSSSAPAPATPVSALLSAGHGNLIAIAAATPTPRCIRVFNLLTSSHHDIFPPLCPDPKFSSLSVFLLERGLIVFNLFIFSHDANGSDGSCTLSYHLVLDERSPVHNTMFIYTSKTESWRSASVPTECRSPPQSIYLENYLPKFDANKANLCFWTSTGSVDKADLVFGNFRECMIAEYHVESNEWEKLLVFSPEFEADLGEKAYLAGGNVFKCQQGRVVMVCADVMDECLSLSSPLIWRQIKGFRVWELQSRQSYGVSGGSMHHWVQVAHSPPSFWEAYYVEYTELKFMPKFIYDGTSICMTSGKHTGSQQKSSAFSHNKLGRYKPPLVYNLDLDSWSYLPRYGSEADDLVGLFTFKPMFKALAQNNTTLI